MRAQKAEHYEVLATVESLETASELEQQYQSKYGYQEKRSNNYLQITNMSTGSRFKPGHNSGFTANHQWVFQKGHKSTYGTGSRYRELSTGFEGYQKDHLDQFDMDPGMLHMSVKKDQAFKKGRFKGMQWIKL